jgi:pteridine reductase
MPTSSDTIAASRPVLLITGAARRIGAAIALYFHERDYDVIIHYNRSLAAAISLRENLNAIRPDSALILQADLADMHAVSNLAVTALQWRSHIDVLINNASSFYATPLGNTQTSQWDELMNSNLKAAYFLSQALAKNLRARHGCIINLADFHADQGLKDYPVYSIAKAGVKMMTRVLALALAPEARVNGISPGAILWPESETDPESQQRILNNIPLGHPGSPQDIACCAWFLATHSHYMTGQTIRVDGGRIIDKSL